MNDLRVYSPAIAVNSLNGREIFYTRRGAGPTYQWNYDDKLARWCPIRLLASDLMSLTINLARWKSIPDSLRNRLAEHYFE